MHDEARVAATPETVGKFVKDGFQVLVECHAGDGALYHDEDYEREGATMVADPQEIYDRAEMILKVKEPLFNEQKQKHEVDMMHRGQYLITFIHPASPVNHDMVRQLTAKGVTAITLDGIPRISRAQNMDALTSMSTCAGYKGILMAANHLTTFVPQMFTAVGRGWSAGSGHGQASGRHYLCSRHSPHGFRKCGLAGCQSGRHHRAGRTGHCRGRLC